MQVVIYKNLRDRIAGRVNTRKMLWPPEEWMILLNHISGETLDVSTEHLFQTSFNAFIPKGCADAGGLMSVDAWMVDRVIDDVRPAFARCNWCGKCTLRSEIEHRGTNSCPKCGLNTHLAYFTKDHTLCRPAQPGSIGYILAVP